MTTHINRLKCAISNAPGVSGALTIAAAASGFRTFGAAHDGMSVDCLLLDGTAWEVRTGCVYTHATTSLTRGTLEDSSTSAAIDLSSATVVHGTMSAGVGNSLEVAMQSITPGGRLTLESGVPISTTDQIAKTTIYYTPYGHTVVPLWDGDGWYPTPFTETALALGTLTASKCYDVFGYLSAGALALELLAWTNDTTRATAVTLQDGRYCKSGDKTRLLLGTFYTTSATTTEYSQTKRLVSNLYNSITSSVYWVGGDNYKSYSSSAYGNWNGTTESATYYVVSKPEGAIVVYQAQCAMSLGLAKFGVNKTTTASWPSHTGEIITPAANFMPNIEKTRAIAPGLVTNMFVYASTGSTSSFNYCEYRAYMPI